MIVRELPALAHQLLGHHARGVRIGAANGCQHLTIVGDRRGDDVGRFPVGVIAIAQRLLVDAVEQPPQHRIAAVVMQDVGEGGVRPERGLGIVALMRGLHAVDRVLQGAQRCRLRGGGDIRGGQAFERHTASADRVQILQR
ncbi:hypothetical protein DW352_04705 [Pseudolabrys taiwanensis]|uniref:Uncharacterized protein n=1 Tax=Pseudolabrys taiwanensis TaxID=331696 RepID=A0A345ZSI3_9HYPH|nr:hypothetical protein DW352_04705 [Pseudolabrys taiwanensis]